MKIAALLIAACVASTAQAQSQAERLAAAEAQIAAAVCGAWRPGAGLTVAGNVRRGWIHSVIPGRHELHIKGGSVLIHNRLATGFDQRAGTSPGLITERYSPIAVAAPAGAVLEWTRPDGVREPVPSIYLYPVGKSGA